MARMAKGYRQLSKKEYPIKGDEFRGPLFPDGQWTNMGCALFDSDIRVKDFDGLIFRRKIDAKA